MITFSKTEKERRYFQALVDKFGEWHKFFEDNPRPTKEMMEKIMNEARDYRKQIGSIEDKFNPKLNKADRDKIVVHLPQHKKDNPCPEFHRCVAHVKKSTPTVNPYAVCSKVRKKCLMRIHTK